MRRTSTSKGALHRLAAIVAAVATLGTAAVTATANAATPTDPVNVTVNGADVAKAAKNRNGLTFKGFGVLTGNSTSALLMDYKAQNPDAYWTLINTLFGGDHPVMNTVKIEMGNDRNTSTGPEPATMRSRDSYPNVAVEPGFQLAADAMKVNPNVRVSILRWRSPAWVTSNDDIYTWYKNTILAVYRQYGYMVDSVNPHINETKPDLKWTKEFAQRVKNDDSGFVGAGTVKDLSGNDVPAWKDDTEKTLFHKLRIIISDEVSTGSFGDDMLADKELRDNVDISGYHYTTGDQGNNFKTLADDYDKEIWNSEAQATFSNTADRPGNNQNSTNGEGEGDGKGTQLGGINSPLEMANWIVTGFDHSRRTMNVYQPAIGSFYDGFQYSSKELLSARDPWSGWVYYDGGLAMLEQISSFAKTGYETDPDNPAANGIWRGIPQASDSALKDGNPPGRGSGDGTARGGAHSYMTLAAPDASDFSTIIVNDSAYTKTYRITAKDMKLGSDKTMELWQTGAAQGKQAYDASYVSLRDEIQPNADGTYEVTVQPWTMLTATTLDRGSKKGQSISNLPHTPEYTDGKRAVLDTDATGDKQGVTDDQYLYADDFEYQGKTVTSYDPKTKQDVTEDYVVSRGGDTGATPRYTNDTNGAFEVYRTKDGDRVMRQQVGPGMQQGSFNGGAWNGGDPQTTIGDYRWANYKVSADVRFEAGGYATLGAREMGGNNSGNGASAAEIKLQPDGAWSLRRYGAEVASGNAANDAKIGFKAGANQWNTLAVQVAGSTYTAYVNGVQVASYEDAAPQANGRVQLGSSYDFVQFDNLKVETVDGYTPYYTDVIDGMHRTSWDDASAPQLIYNEKWLHANGQSMFVWQRTADTSTGKGATLTYTFTGTGLDVFGGNAGKAKLNVTVDGKTIVKDAPTIAGGNLHTSFILRGLSNAKHTVTLETATDDAFNVDAVGIVKANDATAAQTDTTALRQLVEQYAGLNASDWSADSWAVFSQARDAASAAVKDPAGYGLDAEGAAALASRLETARKALVDKLIAPETQDLGFSGAATKNDAASLPKQLTVKGEKVDVIWDDTTADTLKLADDYSKVTLSGVTATVLKDGLKYRFTTSVEAIPANVQYFIDSNGAENAPEYTAVKQAAALRNDKFDQASDGSTWGYDANGTKAKSYSGDLALSDKSDTGWYQDGDTLTYYLPLKAGTYTLTAGAREWWGKNREMTQTVKAADGATLATGSNIKLDAKTATATGTVEFSLPKDQTVTYTLGKVGPEKPVISWLAVAENTDYGFVGATVRGAALPQSVTVNGVTVAVKQWDDSAAEAVNNAEDYTKAAVSGITAEDKRFTAEFEVLPAKVRYFIDSGAGDASPEYTAAKAAVPGLANTKADQPSADASTWGYVADGVKVKTGVDVNDKFATGLYADAGKSIVYRLPLKAGSYTLTAGFHEWWQPRNMKAVITDAGKELNSGNMDLANGDSKTLPLEFTLDADQTVEFTVSKVSADPVISWLAVAEKTGTQPTPGSADVKALKAVVAEALKKHEQDYTPKTWKPFAKALKEAQDLLGNVPDASKQQEVNDAAKKLSDAMDALKSPTSETVDFSKLEDLVNELSKLREDAYTPKTWEPFAEKLDASRKVLDAAKAGLATQTQVDDATAALKVAYGNLRTNGDSGNTEDKGNEHGTGSGAGAGANGNGPSQGKPGANDRLSSTGTATGVIVGSVLLLAMAGAGLELARRRRG